MKAPLLLALAGLSISAVQAAEPTGTLTLACEGTTSNTTGDPNPTAISRGIIVNFTDRTVQGFGYPGPASLDFPVKITDMNGVTVAFEGYGSFGFTTRHIIGSMDRVTGDVHATSTLSDRKSGNIDAQVRFLLKCRPTQRMF